MFQHLVLNLNDDDTNEEISLKARSIARKVKRQEKRISNISTLNEKSIEDNNAVKSQMTRK